MEFEFWSSFPPKNTFPQSSRCNTVNPFKEFYQSLKDFVFRRKFFFGPTRIRTGMLVEFGRSKTWIRQKLKCSLWKLRILNISTQGPQTQISWDSNNHNQDLLGQDILLRLDIIKDAPRIHDDLINNGGEYYVVLNQYQPSPSGLTFARRNQSFGYPIPNIVCIYQHITFTTGTYSS